MIQIITEKTAWNSAVKLAKHSDFYHTYCYHELSKNENETPILIKYKDEKSCVLLALLVKEIENTDYKDARSVYGYTGVLYLSDKSNFDNDNFREELNEYFLEQRIVSIFSRLHPYLEHQEDVLDGLGVISSPGDVVFIDLLEPLEVQRQNYSRRLKTQVNKAQRLCTIIKGETDIHIQAFIDIYYENMQRVNANGSYFFDELYFHQLMTCPYFETELSLVLCNETQEIIAGALFIKTDDIVHYHLSGIKEEYLGFNPIKLVIDRMRVKSTNDGYKYLNLGGGRSCKQDSLFTFKSSFSKHYMPFKLWKFIVNEEAYEFLVNKQKQIEANVDFEIDKEFFPAYRRVLTS